MDALTAPIYGLAKVTIGRADAAYVYRAAHGRADASEINRACI